MTEEKENKIRHELGRCLLGMGVCPNVVGYYNLICSVIYVVDCGNSYTSACSAYAYVGGQTGKSSASVERSIRTVIAKCENTHTLEKLNDFFGYEVYNNYTLSASELISLFAEKYIND